MTRTSFFIRFTAAYTVVMGVTGIIFGLLELENPGATNLIILFGISYWLFHAFGKKNDLALLTNDKWPLIGVGMFGSLLTSILLAIPTALSMEIPLEYLLIGLLISIPLNLLVFVFSHKSAIKTLTQQIAQATDSSTQTAESNTVT
jgi:hypothetical protein